jgi:Tfp pilus assembly protein FimV
VFDEQLFGSTSIRVTPHRHGASHVLTEPAPRSHPMSAQPTIDPQSTTVPRWTPVIVPVTTSERRGRFAALTAPPTAAELAALRPRTRASALRRRAGVLLVLVALVFLVAAGIGQVTADAELADPVAATVTLGPGETLWEVAAATAPDGVGVREQLAAIERLNGFDGAAVQPWTVVLIPAR